MSKQDVQDLHQKYRPTTLKIQQYISLYTWGTFYPCVHQTHLECFAAKTQFVLVSSDLRSQSHLKFQSCLITEYAGDCFWMSEENFSWIPPEQHVVMWWCLTFFKVFWPRDSTIFYNSPSVVLEESLATQTLLLAVHYDDIDTGPHPGSFVTFDVDWKFLIITLMVEMGIFTALALAFLKATSLICEAQLSFAAHQKYILWFFSLWWMIMGIWALFPLIFILLWNRKPWLDNFMFILTLECSKLWIWMGIFFRDILLFIS